MPSGDGDVNVQQCKGHHRAAVFDESFILHRVSKKQKKKKKKKNSSAWQGKGDVILIKSPWRDTTRGIDSWVSK